MWCFVSLFLVVTTSAINCLERFVSEMTRHVSTGMLNPTHSLTHWPSFCLCVSQKFVNIAVYQLLGGFYQIYNFGEVGNMPTVSCSTTMSGYVQMTARTFYKYEDNILCGHQVLSNFRLEHLF